MKGGKEHLPVRKVERRRSWNWSWSEGSGFYGTEPVEARGCGSGCCTCCSDGCRARYPHYTRWWSLRWMCLWSGVKRRKSGEMGAEHEEGLRCEEMRSSGEMKKSSGGELHCGEKKKSSGWSAGLRAVQSEGSGDSFEGSGQQWWDRHRGWWWHIGF